MAMRKFDSPKKAIKEMRRVYFSEVGGFMTPRFMIGIN